MEEEELPEDISGLIQECRDYTYNKCPGPGEVTSDSEFISKANKYLTFRRFKGLTTQFGRSKKETPRTILACWGI